MILVKQNSLQRISSQSWNWFKIKSKGEKIIIFLLSWNTQSFEQFKKGWKIAFLSRSKTTSKVHFVKSYPDPGWCSEDELQQIKLITEKISRFGVITPDWLVKSRNYSFLDSSQTCSSSSSLFLQRHSDDSCRALSLLCYHQWQQWQ